MTENFDEMNPDMAAGTEIQPYTVCEPVEVTNEFSDFDETMNSSALSQVLTSDDDDLSSPSISEPDSSSDEDKYETASEDRGHHRRGRVPHMTANYSATSNKQSSVKKDKKSVIQNNIRIGTMIGNLHVGPSFSAMTSDQWRMPSWSPSREPLVKTGKTLARCSRSSPIIWTFWIARIVPLSRTGMLHSGCSTSGPRKMTKKQPSNVWQKRFLRPGRRTQSKH